MKPYNIRIEYGKTKPSQLCILESAAPLFSWACAAGDGETQAAFSLRVLHDGEAVWQTGWHASQEQSCRYGGPALTPGEVYTLELRLRSGCGAESAPECRRFCPGSVDWDAEWLFADGAASDAVIDFVHDFTCEKPVASACLFVCGLGYHKVELNGEAVFAEPMNPAYSQYDRRAYYSVVPELEGVLRPGVNRIGVRVAAGWRRPDSICYNLVQRIASYTGKTQLSAMLRIRYTDGSVAWLKTGEDWRWMPDAIVSSDIFDGERRDQSRFVPGWSLPETPLAESYPVSLTEAPCARLQPQTLEAICEQETYPARTVAETAPGVWSADFGQNMAGVCRIRIPRDIPAGTEITLRHMEFLDEDGRLYLPQLRNAASVDTYIAAGNGRDPEFWQPEFTYHGFRYAEVTGYPGPLLRGDIEAQSLYTDVFSDGFFTCGEPLLNTIYKCSLQGEKSNIHSVLTDCPQRDERMGWLNDATSRFEATPYIADVGRLFPKIVRDCMDVQDADGSITCTAPFAFGCRPADPVCSSYLLAGWEAWLHTGNLEILEEGFEGFAAWNAFLRSHSENGIVDYSYYGDWAAPAYACQSEEFAVSAVTPGILMSTGYYYFNSRLLAQIAGLLGKPERAEAFRREAEGIREAFLKKWWNAETGCVGTGSQGCQSFALWLDILPEEGSQRAADFLHSDLVEKQFRFTTGNLCTRYMLEMLVKYGYVEDAWTLLTREEYPSIGFMIQNEATTVWERFELKKNPLMNSHNHPMYGAVSRWFFACLAGLTPLDGGWKRFAVQPCFPEKLLSASAGVPTPYGEAVLRWVHRYGSRYVYLQVPFGTTAVVTLPGLGTFEAGSGFHHWELPE